MARARQSAPLQRVWPPLQYSRLDWDWPQSFIPREIEADDDCISTD
jgi:hypothetical protein